MVAALAAGSAGDTSAKLLSFTTISRGSSQPTVGADRNFGKTFVDIIGRVTDPGGWTTFVPKNRRNEDRRRQLPNSFCDRRSRPGAKYWISGHDQTHHALACLAFKASGRQIRRAHGETLVATVPGRPVPLVNPDDLVVRESRGKVLGASTGPVTAGLERDRPERWLSVGLRPAS